LWRGQAFADVSSLTIRAAAASLEERRILTVEAKAESDLAIGRCELVAAELSGWLAAFPLRERLRGLAMVALYRLGCRNDALYLYRDGRQTMIAALGLEPGPQLRSLHQRILADDEWLRTSSSFSLSRTMSASGWCRSTRIACACSQASRAAGGLPAA
jgi:DNA-binding SARP family transcriptional activator